MNTSVYTINSVSGGKTSAFMYLKYPTDFSVFALVKSAHPVNTIKDPYVLKEVQSRCPGAVGSMELEETLIAVLELEQLGGRKIHWVASQYTFEDLVMANTNLPGYRTQPMLPNKRKRFCTQYLKIQPIFEYFYYKLSLKMPLMNIGFRADEFHRVAKYDNCKELNFIRCPVKANLKSKRNSWRNIEWREVLFPLFLDGVTREYVLNHISSTGVRFPDVSNCAYCPFHTVSEHKQQYASHPNQINAWIDLENQVSNFYDKSYSFFKKFSLQNLVDKKFNVETDSDMGCQCTD